jgi:hypothetical protein
MQRLVEPFFLQIAVEVDFQAIDGASRDNDPAVLGALVGRVLRGLQIVYRRSLLRYSAQSTAPSALRGN